MFIIIFYYNVSFKLKVCLIYYMGLLFQRLFAENKEKLISGALNALVTSAASCNNMSHRDLEAQFHALRRLCASKVGFAAFTALPGYDVDVNIYKAVPLINSLLTIHHFFVAVRRHLGHVIYIMWQYVDGIRFREWLGSTVSGALRRGASAVSHAALDAVCALLQPMHADPDLRQEQLNKASMLSSASFLEALLAMWASHVVRIYNNNII